MIPPRRGLVAAAAALSLQMAVAAAGEEAAITGVDVRGTALMVRLADGRVLGPQELLGAVLEASDEQGRPLTVRIDRVALDPLDPEREVVLYRLSTPGPAGTWREFCERDQDGRRWALPLAGRWTAAGEHLPDPTGASFNVTCTSGAIGKCVRLGYKPWKALTDGTSLWAHHQACVRLLRADYCGDGRSFTRAGTLVDPYDRLGIQTAEPGMRFEAGWGKDGATCVARVRIPEEVTLEGLARRCPARLEGRVGTVCTEAEARRSPATLLFNKS